MHRTNLLIHTHRLLHLPTDYCFGLTVHEYNRRLYDCFFALITLLLLPREALPYWFRSLLFPVPKYSLSKSVRLELQAPLPHLLHFPLFSVHRRRLRQLQSLLDKLPDIQLRFYLRRFLQNLPLKSHAVLQTVLLFLKFQTLRSFRNSY